MRRRTLLSAVGSGFLAGCLGDGRRDETPTVTPVATPVATPASTAESPTPTERSAETQDYEQCDRIVVTERMLTEELLEEVRTALETGAYEAESVLLAEAIDVDIAYVRVDDTHYRATVEAGEGRERLTLSAVETPRLPSKEAVTVTNRTEDDHEFHVTVEDGDLLDVTVTLGEHDRERYPVTDAFGTYELRAEVDGEVSTYEWRLDEAHRNAVVEYGADELFVTQVVADVPPCPWQDY